MSNCLEADQALHNVGPDLHPNCLRERSGSVVECLTQDRRATGSSLTGSLRCGTGSTQEDPSLFN